MNVYQRTPAAGVCLNKKVDKMTLSLWISVSLFGHPVHAQWAHEQRVYDGRDGYM